MMQCFGNLCNWKKPVCGATELAKCLISELQATNSNEFSNGSLENNCSQYTGVTFFSKISSQRPSGYNLDFFSFVDMMFKYRKALELLAVVEGWTWTNNVLLLEIIWPILQHWAMPAAVTHVQRPEKSLVEILIKFLGKLSVILLLILHIEIIQET